MTPAQGRAACPLCGQAAGPVVQSIPYREVWNGLERDWGARISPAVVARHSPRADAVLVECAGCGLRYFDPPQAGDADFYAELSTSAAYYSDDKWEFGLVRDRLAPGRAVLDVGCGDGRFLHVVKPVAREAVGIETNPEAVDRARAEGLDVRLATVEAFAAANPERFDVVCSFHVLEHLPELGPFVRAMLACLRPGGTLAVSVPNRLRIADPDALQPLDCPPHHVSRWHPRQFRRFAELFGVRLLGVEFEPPEMHECRGWLRERTVRRFGARAGYPLGRALGRAVFSPTLYGAFRRAGALPRLGVYRHAMLARFAKPS